MKVWVYVEGESDCLALNALFASWLCRMRKASWAIKMVSLDNKSKYFRKIGPRAAEKLVADPQDLVVGLPDYYPNREYAGTPYEHTTLVDLLKLQRRLVSDALAEKGKNPPVLLERFCASAMKHDMEMLLLAATEALRSHLGTQDRLQNWQQPVEEQNQNHPPKRVVEDLYRTRRKHAYRDTTDAPAVLGRVTDLREIVYAADSTIQCPVFKAMMDWVGQRTSVPPY
jgi:hypothetical protein